MNEIKIQGTPYEYTRETNDFLDEIVKRVKDLHDTGDLSRDVLQRLRQYFKVKNIYHSNAIEGNQLDIGQTKQVVEHGVTVPGGSIKDRTEASNLSEALDSLETLTQDDREITAPDVRALHAIVLQHLDDDNAGSYRERAVLISGSSFEPPSPEQVAVEMTNFSDWLKVATDPKRSIPLVRDALLLAVTAHAWLVYIHPFIDGNGRTARLLMNLILMRSGFPIAIIRHQDRNRYYDALEASQASDVSPLLRLVGECIQESLDEYEAAVTEEADTQEWASGLAARLTHARRRDAGHEYEIWKQAMSWFRAIVQGNANAINSKLPKGQQIFFKEFGELDFDKYLLLRDGKPAKSTWFFRIDLLLGRGRADRYLFFFHSPGPLRRSKCSVTLHVAREEPMNSYNYVRLTDLPDLPEGCLPDLAEIGYAPESEKFRIATLVQATSVQKPGVVSRKFLTDAIEILMRERPSPEGIIQQVGGIVFRYGTEGPQFALVQDRTRRWTRAKGKIIQSDSDELSAFKRVMEDELGVGVDVIWDDFERHSIDNRLPGGRKVRKEVIYYIGETRDENLVLKDKPGLLNADWHTYETARDLKFYSDQKENILKTMADVADTCTRLREPKGYTRTGGPEEKDGIGEF